jgi:hypothetical protein
MVKLQIGKQRGGFGFVNARTRRATVILAGHLRRGTRLIARYAGNARLAPSSATKRR